MQETLVLTIVGVDHPGIVNQISQVVNNHGGNWHESRMAHLAGQFAGLMRVQVASVHTDDLRAALSALSAEGLQVTVVKDSDTPAASGERQTLNLEVTGSDHAGIVRDITGVLSRHGINVEELSTEVSPAPMSSHNLFTATAKMHADSNLDLDRLQDELEGLSHDLIFELSVQLHAHS